MSVLLLCVIMSFTYFHGSEASTGYKITDWRHCPDSKTRYLAISQISLEHCVHSCKVRPTCKAISYQRLFQLCEIYSEESDTSLKLTDGRTPCVFVVWKDIKQDNISCNCAKGQVCNIMSGLCEIKECSPYVSDDDDDNSVTVQGNRNEIMSKIELSCQPVVGEFKQVISKCNSDGNWSQVLECGPECPVGNEWLQQDRIPNFQLQFNLETLNHTLAKQKCETSGSRLVRIDTVEKREYIKKICTTCEGLLKYYWTDGSTIFGDMAMRFSDSSAMPLGDMYWQPGRPDNSDPKLKCARAEPPVDYRWRDAYCDELFPYICETL